MDFKSILVQNGIQTRLVPCEIQIAFEQLNTSNEEMFKKEYIALSQNRYGSITQWLNKIKSKNRTEDTDEVLLELLVELYQKVENIEQILNNTATRNLGVWQVRVSLILWGITYYAPLQAYLKQEKSIICVFFCLYFRNVI